MVQFKGGVFERLGVLVEEFAADGAAAREGDELWKRLTAQMQGLVKSAAGAVVGIGFGGGPAFDQSGVDAVQGGLQTGDAGGACGVGGGVARLLLIAVVVAVVVVVNFEVYVNAGGGDA